MNARPEPLSAATSRNVPLVRAIVRDIPAILRGVVGEAPVPIRASLAARLAMAFLPVGYAAALILVGSQAVELLWILAFIGAVVLFVLTAVGIDHIGKVNLFSIGLAAFASSFIFP